jgi:hypothetical protein
LPVAEAQPFIAGQLLQSHRAARADLVGADADFLRQILAERKWSRGDAPLLSGEQAARREQVADEFCSFGGFISFQPRPESSQLNRRLTSTLPPMFAPGKGETP